MPLVLLKVERSLKAVVYIAGGQQDFKSPSRFLSQYEFSQRSRPLAITLNGSHGYLAEVCASFSLIPLVVRCYQWAVCCLTDAESFGYKTATKGPGIALIMQPLTITFIDRMAKLAFTAFQLHDTPISKQCREQVRASGGLAQVVVVGCETPNHSVEVEIEATFAPRRQKGRSRNKAQRVQRNRYFGRDVCSFRGHLRGVCREKGC